MIAWAKEHPYLAGSLAIGVFLLYLVWRGRSSAAAASGGAVYGPSDALQAADLQAGAQLQMAQIGAGVQTGNTNAALAANEFATSADVQKAYYAAQNQLQTTLSSQEVSDALTAAQLQLGLANIGGVLALSGKQGEVLTAPGSTIYGATAASIGATATQAQTQAQINTAAAAIPAATYTPPVPVSIAPAGGGFQGYPGLPQVAGYTPVENPIIAAGGVAPGGTPVVAPFPVIPVGAWPNPVDVATNVQNQINYENAVLTAQAQNNRDQCLANAALSQGAPNYSQLVAACG